MTLFENIIEQMKEMRIMEKRPKALRVDRASLAALANQTGWPELFLPGAQLLGLAIEVEARPNFEVV